MDNSFLRTVVLLPSSLIIIHLLAQYGRRVCIYEGELYLLLGTPIADLKNIL